MQYKISTRSVQEACTSLYSAEYKQSTRGGSCRWCPRPTGPHGAGPPLLFPSCPTRPSLTAPYAFQMPIKHAVRPRDSSCCQFKIKPCQKIKTASLSQWRAFKSPYPLQWIDPVIFPFQDASVTTESITHESDRISSLITDDIEVDFEVYIGSLTDMANSCVNLLKLWTSTQCCL